MKRLEENYSREELQKIIYESTSISEIILKIGYKKNNGGYHTRIKKYLQDNGYDLTKLQGRHFKKYSNKGIPHKNLSELLVDNSTINSNSLKQRLITYGVKEYKCENPDCGISDWHGQPLTLQLHHINGNHYDNRLENLVLLCPNCHSQTCNFTSQNNTIDSFNEKLKEIAINKSKTAIENLLLFEEKFKAIKKVNKEKTYKKILIEKKTLYCKQCGNIIKGNGKVFCSINCMTQYQKEHSNININKVIELSKKCKSLIELSVHFKVSDNGLKKRLKKEGVFEEVMNNLKYNKDEENKILQYDLNNNFIKEWKNAIEASTILQINKNGIYKCCRGEIKTCHNFIWKFKNKKLGEKN